ncbi:23S rRNA (adenine(1618)-N(6))-methyltransferase RlmF [Pseudoalteromonas sp. SR44-5]|uniref:23S rRNA (adenine(1618)-N(6))-methyltransferase RlmF n=1 Tax=unclassified Pseudoalteromonas TaxID=194690 RepID=UPI001603C401|nr:MULTISPECIES: 23S rRNA (adenine(1618)-N(6))-methyltransferase RlmF [unclassified Pseudoalteromonas]MBB1333441.1 23S rRNA (adenine(1618)-N(6))-methyltransferase RlmF [Pseudoalteromonas sp. SR41-6]MBB1340988.1 23S rRNA (adenine(1618)-N(6))-methyltransferase RlmF [Pseudoalteromonas sp. SR45-6]MBB1366084.1 23S rRNA (adenine(1618)-N(6))-methyltransferase RlmF [Pseudoalteromonas sp. SR44-5]MBB1416680.1 23S rRNA (adenine(1618)-N(6))-methyltransferase RlmF [Pseudoalteromonas sp. SG44-1]MBB1424230.1
MKSTPLKSKLHPRNRHNEGYDLDYLSIQVPTLKPYIVLTPNGTKSIDFSDNKAVKTLNQALLQAYYNVDFWDIPEHNLCPPIPGRVDYIHYLADLLANDNQGVIPQGRQVKVLDIGTGANIIYPLLASHEYNWSVTGSDIDPSAVKLAKQIVQFNNRKITVKLQKQSQHIFQGVINAKELFHITLCNPPFHASEQQAAQSSERKWKNLGKAPKSALNFGGQHNELWCEGGEAQFICTMIDESALFAEQCMWFTSLVSKKENLATLQAQLKTHPVAEVKIIEMAQGQKVSRFIAWSYFDQQTRQEISQQFTQPEIS